MTNSSLPKLIIQIPCYNEAETLPKVIADLPRMIPGVSSVEYLIIDDGSSDGTAEVARRLGVHHVIALGRNQGLANAFRVGIESCLVRGADIIVNTDGDNQYAGQDVPKLIRPILDGKADMVVGERPIENIREFSWLKKKLQRIGTGWIRAVSRTTVQDATSGFRAYTRDAALRLRVFSNYTYTLETLIQAGSHGVSVASVPIRVNGKLRESRLMRSIPQYIYRSIVTVSRIFLLYNALRTFLAIGALFLAAGMLIGARFIWLFVTVGGQGMVQSLILASICILVGFQMIIFGFVADLIAANRTLLEDTLYRLKRSEYKEQ